MSTQQIKNLTGITPLGAMKIPTGGFGDYAVTVEGLANYTVSNFQLNGKTIQRHLDQKVNKVVQDNTTATTVEELVADFNLLLSQLR